VLADRLAVERGVTRLREALESGEWDRRFGHLRTQPECASAVRLIVAR